MEARDRTNRVSAGLMRACAYCALIAGGCVFSLPFLWTVSTALKTPQNVFRSPPQLIPNPVAWDNFAKAWTALPFPTFVTNTLVITVIATAAQVLSGSLVAYGFARFEFRGQTHYLSFTFHDDAAGASNDDFLCF